MSGNTQEQGAEAPEQQTAEGAALAALVQHAAAADAEVAGAAMGPGGEPPPDAGPPVDRGAEFAAMLGLGVQMLAPALPFLPECYTPAACAQIGTAFAAVAEKRGWQLDDLMTPEVALLVAAAPPTVAAVMRGRVHFAELRARREAAEAAQRAQQQRPRPVEVATHGG